LNGRRESYLDDFYSDGRNPRITPELVFETSGIVDRGGDRETVFGWDFGTSEPGLEGGEAGDENGLGVR